ncbi:pyridoxamine 5'-phosphate oxidase family protein [Mucilaginibacter sp. BJC16-A38]|uniref:pyridoxamine 5'-phosphate oxidase family protein n=1 Tax=Mucilaginibacter phenanthrenivorans TaxID=1234842 RepID=UPI0021575913|nr:pyridoxamine 5'-phosphate oxidase family protein [Mucilaginibacter phenanthrenivorans]MCR8557047.1 pyridoxamine 5'-phosphate oxidase family protein [Mucilaginibacter phenanthrenivorans]
MNYSEIAFSDASKRFQERYGSRASYARMEQYKITDGLTESEVDFISHQDNFYMATIGESGFPYIQFRGGPKGFLKVLDEQTLGFIDFGGNKQYISVGNLATNNKISLFLLDQAAKARLKIYAEAEVLEIEGNEQLFDKLNLEGYKFKPERIIVLNVKAYDWNCPQHITERYTLEEIRDEFMAQHEYINKLRAEVAGLKKRLGE